MGKPFRRQILRERDLIPRVHPSPVDNTTLADLIEFIGELE